MRTDFPVLSTCNYPAPLQAFLESNDRRHEFGSGSSWLEVASTSRADPRGLHGRAVILVDSEIARRTASSRFAVVRCSAMVVEVVERNGDLLLLTAPTALSMSVTTDSADTVCVEKGHVEVARAPESETPGNTHQPEPLPPSLADSCSANFCYRARS